MNFTRLEDRDLNITELFLNDINRIPIIRGKATYRPLTRRVERGRLLMKLKRKDISLTLLSIQKRLRHNLLNLKNVLGEKTNLFLLKAIEDADTFIDLPKKPYPPSLRVLKRHLTSKELTPELWASSWECVYLLSLIPPGFRKKRYTGIDKDILLRHFHSILQEYKTSKKSLLEGTMRYSIRFARQYLHADISYLDLIQEGFIGQLRAIDKFKESVGAHFQSYCAHWIMQRMTRYIADYSRLIRIPVHQHEKYLGIKRIMDSLDEGTILSDYELFVRLGWLDTSDVEHIKTYYSQRAIERVHAKLEECQRVLSYKDKNTSSLPDLLRYKVLDIISAQTELEKQQVFLPDIDLFLYLGWLTGADLYYINKPLCEVTKEVKSSLQKLNSAKRNMQYYEIANAHHHSLAETFYDDEHNHTNVEDYLIALEDAEAQSMQTGLYHGIDKFLECLNEREREIINLRYGLEDGEARTLEEVGQKQGVTRERIRQIEARALLKLRQYHTWNKNSNMNDFGEISEVDSLRDQMKHDLLKLMHHKEPFIVRRDRKVKRAYKRSINRLIDKYVVSGRNW